MTRYNVSVMYVVLIEHYYHWVFRTLERAAAMRMLVVMWMTSVATVHLVTLISQIKDVKVELNNNI